MNLLEQKIFNLQKKGWILLSSTEKTAQLRKPKRGFSCLPNLIWTIIGILGLVFGVIGFIPGFIIFVIGAIVPVIYLFIHLLQRERLITLAINEQGEITSTRKII
jgi:hypothetical protein